MAGNVSRCLYYYRLKWVMRLWRQDAIVPYSSLHHATFQSTTLNPSS